MDKLTNSLPSCAKLPHTVSVDHICVCAYISVAQSDIGYNLMHQMALCILLDSMWKKLKETFKQ